MLAPVDALAGRIQRASCEMRRRWNRSHFEVAAGLMVASAGCWLVDVITDPRGPVLAALGVFLVFISTAHAFATQAMAVLHNRPLQVGEWDWPQRMVTALELTVTPVIVSWLALTGSSWPVIAALVLVTAGGIIGRVPGLKVDYEPPAEGRLATETGQGSAHHEGGFFG